MAGFGVLDPQSFANQDGGILGNLPWPNSNASPPYANQGSRGILGDFSSPSANAPGDAPHGPGASSPAYIPSFLLTPSLLANVSPPTSLLRRAPSGDNAGAAPNAPPIGPTNISGPAAYNFLSSVPQPTPPSAPQPPAIDRQAAAAYNGGQHPFGATDEVTHYATMGLTRPLYAGAATLGPAKTVLGLNDPTPESSSGQHAESIGEAYARARHEYDAAKAAYEADHPYASSAAKLVGSVVGLGKFAPLVRGAAAAGSALARGAGGGGVFGRIIPLDPGPATPGATRSLFDIGAQTANDVPSVVRYTWPGEAYRRYETADPLYSKVTPGGGLKPDTFAALAQ
jgi:hypothetical protein